MEEELIRKQEEEHRRKQEEELKQKQKVEVESLNILKEEVYVAEEILPQGVEEPENRLEENVNDPIMIENPIIEEAPNSFKNEFNQIVVLRKKQVEQQTVFLI